MRVARWWLMLALVAAVATAPAVGTAQTFDDGSMIVVPELPGDELERWWGALGAALCGAEGWMIRNRVPLAMHPAAIAAGLGGCLLAALDIATT